MNGRARPDWPNWALAVAEAAATRSEDPYIQVGACILRADHSVASVGYNGSPPGIDIDYSQRDTRRVYIIHAEMNAMRYTSPGEGVLMVTTLMPCKECLKNIISYGIRDVVYGEILDNEDVYDVEEIINLAKDMGVSLRHINDLSVVEPDDTSGTIGEE